MLRPCVLQKTCPEIFFHENFFLEFFFMEHIKEIGLHSHHQFKKGLQTDDNSVLIATLLKNTLKKNILSINIVLFIYTGA